jgi:hypothetical protein
MRRSLAWLSALPLIVAGSQVAHVFAYRWVYPSSQVRLQALLATGHGYMDQLPLVFGIGAAVASLSLLAAVLETTRGRPLRGLPAWAFALLPLLTFVAQEILERSLHSGTLVWQAVESPTFLPGLVLQLPFALIAYLTARLLLRTAAAVGQVLRRLRVPPVGRGAAAVRPPVGVSLPRLAPLAGSAAGRAPPLFAR